MGATELSFVEEAFRTNFIAPVGPHVDAFEKEFAERFGFRHAAAISSGTAAIHLALRMLKVKPGDEVACSSFTFAASANPILYERARPVFIDSDAATWNMDPRLLEHWLAGRAREGRLPRAVVAVDLYGHCADLERIAAICDEYQVPLIEDAAEALGSTFAGKAAGSFGRMGIFSFNGNKIITTSGGGMLVSDDGDLIAQARFLATQARDAAQHYQHSQTGFNYRMSNVLAGIGRAQLQVLGERVDARRRVYARYFEELSDLPGVDFMPEAPLSRSNRWLTCLTIDPEKAKTDNEKIRRALEAENIEARLTWKPLHLQPVFAGCESVGGETSLRLFQHGLCLPSGSAMTAMDVQRVIDVVRTAFPGKPVHKRAAKAAVVRTVAPAASPMARIRGYLEPRLMKVTRAVLGWGDTHISDRKPLRFFALLVAYAFELAAVFYLSYEMRWDFSTPEAFQDQRITLLLPIIICKLILLHSFGQFRSVLSYFGLADFGGVVISMTTVSTLMLALWYGSEVMAAPPRGVILMDFVLSVASLSAFRLSLRIIRTWSISGEKRSGLVERQVAILGTGDAGQQYAKDLLQRRGCGLRPVLFIDEDTEKAGQTIHGLPVYSPLEKLYKLRGSLRVDELVIAQTGIPPERLRKIVELGQKIGATTQLAPSVKQTASGELKVEQCRPVTIEDLLGRTPVGLDSEGISRLLQEKVVMVTGAGGSIGREICRQILSQNPSRLIMLEKSEIALFEIEQEMIDAGWDKRILALIADVADESAVRAVLAKHRPAIIFHAAAHKHVPLMERQPREALLNNTLATATLTRLASEFSVEKFIFISTDKAINPTSVMGCSKRLAEKALQACQHAPGNQTIFLAVRFGNVLGSSGSVIPTFRRQIEQGGPVTVTHPEMTRYFMTIAEAVGLVLQTANLGKGGEIFILDMGQPMKIIDMARQMIALSGYRPNLDIEIKITGLRPGEKLFEELRHTEETHAPTEHSRIFQLRNGNGHASVDALIAEIKMVIAAGDPVAIKQVLKRLVPEYTPFLEPSETMAFAARPPDPVLPSGSHQALELST